MPFRLLRARRVVAALVVVSVLVLAVIGGRYLFGQSGIAVHGYIGNGVFLGALVNVGLAVASRDDRTNLVLAGLIAIGVFAQVGLGYVGRESVDAASWHIPNGVLLMGLSSSQLMWLMSAPARSRTSA